MGNGASRQGNGEQTGRGKTGAGGAHPTMQRETHPPCHFIPKLPRNHPGTQTTWQKTHLPCRFFPELPQYHPEPKRHSRKSTRHIISSPIPPRTQTTRWETHPPHRFIPKLPRYTSKPKQCCGKPTCHIISSPVYPPNMGDFFFISHS